MPGERSEGFDSQVIVDPHHVPGMDDSSVPEADSAVAPVDRTVRTRADAVIEDERAPLRHAPAHSVRIEHSGFLRGIPAEDLNSVTLFQRVLDERKAPAGVFPAAKFVFCPANHVFCQFRHRYFTP